MPHNQDLNPVLSMLHSMQQQFLQRFDILEQKIDQISNRVSTIEAKLQWMHSVSIWPVIVNFLSRQLVVWLWRITDLLNVFHWLLFHEIIPSFNILHLSWPSTGTQTHNYGYSKATMGFSWACMSMSEATVKAHIRGRHNVIVFAFMFHLKRELKWRQSLVVFNS